MSTIEKIIDYAIKVGASDLHLAEGKTPIVRIHGKITPISAKGLIVSRDDILFLIEKHSRDLMHKFQEEMYLDFSFQQGETRFRANFYMERKKVACALRAIPSLIPEIDSLNLPTAVKNILGLKNGLVLVTGATGSGKSTTIASIINEINKVKSEHILTIEDPIEFIYKDVKSMVHQRELGVDCRNFHDAILCALREDPDIVVLGEIRTHESISSALTLAETGHLVFATLHTKSASESIDRIIDVFPPEQQNQIRVQLANTLKYVIAQRLVPKKIGAGRVALIELMVVNQAISAGIISKSPTGTIRDQISLNSRTLGSQSFEQGAERLVELGLVDKDEVNKFL